MDDEAVVEAVIPPPPRAVPPTPKAMYQELVKRFKIGSDPDNKALLDLFVQDGLVKKALTNQATFNRVMDSQTAALAIVVMQRAVRAMKEYGPSVGDDPGTRVLPVALAEPPRSRTEQEAVKQLILSWVVYTSNGRRDMARSPKWTKFFAQVIAAPNAPHCYPTGDMSACALTISQEIRLEQPELAEAIVVGEGAWPVASSEEVLEAFWMLERLWISRAVRAMARHVINSFRSTKAAEENSPEAPKLVYPGKAGEKVLNEVMATIEGLDHKRYMKFD